MKIQLLGSGHRAGPEAGVNLGDMAQQLHGVALLEKVWPGSEVEISAHSRSESGIDPGHPLLHDFADALFPSRGAMSKLLSPFRLALLVLGARRVARGSSAFGVSRAGESVIRRFAASEFLFFSGAGILNEKYVRGPAFVWLAAIWLMARLGKPIVLLGQQIGPFKPGSPASRYVFWTLRRATFVGCRDGQSARDVVRHGVSPEKVGFTGDEGAYFQAGDEAAARSLLDRLGVAGPFIAVHLRVDGNCRFQGAIDEFARYFDALSERLQARPVFVPMAYGGAHDETTLARELRGKMRADLAILDCPDAALTKAVLRQATLAVGVANHFLVFAASEGVPTIGIHSTDYMAQKLRGIDEAYPTASSFAFTLEPELWERMLTAGIESARSGARREEPKPPSDYLRWVELVQAGKQAR